MSHRITPCYTVSHHVTLCHTLLYHITQCLPCHTICIHITPYRTMSVSHHITLCHTMLHLTSHCHTISTISHYVTPYHAVSHHIIHCHTHTIQTFHQKVLDDIVVQKLEVVMANPTRETHLQSNVARRRTIVTSPLLQVLLSPSEKVIHHGNLGIPSRSQDARQRSCEQSHDHEAPPLTSWPSLMSWSTRCEPTNPEPPVTCKKDNRGLAMCEQRTSKKATRHRHHFRNHSLQRQRPPIASSPSENCSCLY